MHKFIPFLLVLSLNAFATSANFDGVGGDDLSVYDVDTGDWYILSLNGDVLAFAQNWGWNQAVPAPWDYNNDGITDLAVYARGTGKWYIVDKGTGQLIAFDVQWGDDSMISVPGDYNGDGKGDLAVYQPATGNWYIVSLDGELLAFGENWGGEGMVPVSGDFNGDGKSDLAVYHRATGNWYIRTLDGELILFDENWGSRDMTPVPGDFNGDGKSDMAVYMQKTGKWYIRTVDGSLILFDETWGWSAAQPVAGDYNGNGKDDLAVYHRATGNWYIRTVEGELIAWEVNWGLPNSTPSQTYAHRSTAGYTIVCFGDSITYGRGSQANGPETGYPALLERKLDQAFGGMFRCFNAGYPGETSSRGAVRLPSVLDSVPHAQVLLLMEGTNDALSDSMFQTTGNHLRNMLSEASSRGMDTFLSTVPPIVPVSPLRAMQASRVHRFNSSIPSIAGGVGARVVHTYHRLRSQTNWTSLYDSPNHPNDAGYQIVRDAFFESLQNWLRQGI